MSLPIDQVQQVWKQACQMLQQRLSPSAYNTWIITNSLTEFRFVGDDRAVAVLNSPTAFHSINVEKNFYAQIKEVIDLITGRNCELQFQVGSPVSYQPSSPPTPPTFIQQPPVNVSSPSPVVQLADQNNRVITSATNISTLQDRIKALAEQQSTTPPLLPSFSPKGVFSSTNTRENLFSDQTVQAVTVDRARLQAQRAGLRLDYTFDTFAVSTTNEMAHAAAMAVSGQPGTAYNPLFIYGGVGVGKTHLMHAVGNNILKNNPEMKVLYCTGEDFTNEIVSAIQTKKAMHFKEKFRTVDILLIDDVQFIAGKNTVQEEFFHTFNTITKRFGQVIMTSDQPPQEIALLEDRLRSRFEAGLMVDIQQPSFELRTAILLIKASAYQLNIPMNLAQAIAAQVDSARKIEGIMKSIKSEVELKHREITQSLIDDLFQNEMKSSSPKQRLRVKPYDVIKSVSDFYHIKQSVIRGPQRVKSIVRARHVAMYFLKEELKLPLLEIGRWFSDRDHTSVMHAIRKIHSEVLQDTELRQEMDEVHTQLVKISK